MRSIVLGLALLTLACQPQESSEPQEFTEAQRAQVEQEVMDAANAFVAGLSSLDGDEFIASFTDAGDLVYVDAGRIYPDRDALRNAAAGFMSRQERIGGMWDPAHVVVLGPDGAAFTGVFHADVVDTAGVAQWTTGKIWTFVYERRDGAWTIVQAHESNGRAETEGS